MKRTKYEVASMLIEELWNVFQTRVSYACTYKNMVTRRGGMVVPDHIGFRSLNTHTGEQPGGIWGIRHIFENLGYVVAGEYIFSKKKLNAVHLNPPTEDLPKIFISQLKVDLLPEWVQRTIDSAVANTPYLISDTGIKLLSRLTTDGNITAEAADILVDELVKYFRCPWNPPAKNALLKINDVNHYAAWVLIHGNSPSHFAMLVNDQKIAAWPDLETTCTALQQAGIPMKRKIGGTSDSYLQQSASLAVKEDIAVKAEGSYELLTWTYAYLELISRAHNVAEENHLVQDFLVENERQLYQLTVTLDN